MHRHCGATAGCSRPTRMAARTCRPISTTTHFSPTRCSSCCRRAGAAAIWSSRTPLVEVMLDAIRGPRRRRIFLHRRRIMSGSFIAARPSATIHSVRQRRRGIRALPAGVPSRRSPVSRRCRAHAQGGVAADAGIPSGAHEPVERVGGFPRADEIVIIRGASAEAHRWAARSAPPMRRRA